jgi:hypothetical protein
MKRLQLYQVAFSHAPPMHLMAYSVGHAIRTAQELCPSHGKFMSCHYVPEWNDHNSDSVLHCTRSN